MDATLVERTGLSAHDPAEKRQGVAAGDLDDVDVGVAAADQPADDILPLGGGLAPPNKPCADPDVGGLYGRCGQLGATALLDETDLGAGAGPGPRGKCF